MLEVLSELKGIVEIQVFIEDAFFEMEDAKYEDVIQRLNLLWRKEFDKKLAQKEFSK